MKSDMSSGRRRLHEQGLQEGRGPDGTARFVPLESAPPPLPQQAEGVIAVWPCTHGSTLVEPGPALKGYQCHQCGAVAASYVPLAEVERLRAEKDVEREANGRTIQRLADENELLREGPTSGAAVAALARHIAGVPKDYPPEVIAPATWAHARRHCEVIAAALQQTERGDAPA